MLKDDDYLILKPEWVLRNDGNKVILYLTSTKNIEYQILDPVTATVISLINGRRCVGDLTKTIGFLFDISTDSSRSLLENIVNVLNDKLEKIDVLAKGVAIIKRRYSTSLILLKHSTTRFCKTTQSLG